MQDKVRTFVNDYSVNHNEKIWYIDLVSEIGELGKEILKATEYGNKKVITNTTSIEEMGDCLFSILALCCEMNIDAEEALNFALNKYKQRNELKGNIGSNT